MLSTTVLIVEDEALIAEEIRDLVEQIGHTVIGVADTAEQALVASGFLPGVVPMDIRLKGEIDGIEAAYMIQELSSPAIVYMTAHSDQPTIDRAMLTLPYGYLVKPVRQSDLAATLQTALARQSAEAHLRAGEEQSRTILDQVSDLVVRTLPDGRLLSVSSTCRELLGYSSAQISRMKLSDLVFEEDRDSLREALDEMIVNGGNCPLAIRLSAHDGTLVSVEGTLGSRTVQQKLDGFWAVFRAQ